MNRSEFEQKYKHVFTDSKIIEYLKTHDRETYVNSIIEVSAFIADKYDRDVAYRKKAYTPHDFAHHIVNVIEIADKLLRNNINDFNPEDLFCFLLACILHDIGMVYFATDNRFYHSYIAADLISDLLSPDNAPNDLYTEIITYAKQNKPKLEDPTLIDNFRILIQDSLNTNSINDRQRRKIAVMVLGHSDLKFSSPKKTFNTLDRRLYEDCEFDSFTNIHVLAAFLRWADELDLSKSRCYGIGRDELPEDSKPFWDKLNLVSKVTITPARITLSIDRTEYKKQPEQSYNLLYGIINKLNTERITCSNSVFRPDDKIEYEFPEITLESINPVEIRNLFADHAPESSSEIVGEDSLDPLETRASERLCPDVLRSAIDDYIKEWHLCKEGHYCLHDEKEVGAGNAVCIRNPLDCNGLLSRHYLLDDIAQVLLSKIPKDKDTNLDEYILIGIANSGALIAAHMSALSGLPFAPWVPKNKDVQYTQQEKNLDYFEKQHPTKKVVLVIGVNYTGKAIADAYDKFKNVKCVVGLINRDIGDKNETDMMLEAKELYSYFIIRGYEIEKCQYSGKKTCPYGKICNQHSFDQE